MMRVTHVLNGLAIGGMERAALRLAQRGLRDGHRHDLILYDAPFRDTDLDFDPGVVPVTFMPRGGGLDLRFALTLGHHLRREKPDAVHAHNETALVYAALAARLAVPHRPKVVATFHTWPSHVSRGARLMCRLASTRAQAIAVSCELAQRLLRAGWIGACKTIWNGVDTSEFTPYGTTEDWRLRLGIGTDVFVVGHVARFDEIKRHGDMLAAARLLADRVPSVVFVFVGQGQRLDEIRHDAEGLPNVRFVPSVADMPPLLRSFDAIALCSAHEAAPLCLLEGMACGLPVVATAVGGVPHLVGEAPGLAAGILVPSLDPLALSSAIAALCDNPALRSRISTAARVRAEAFSFEDEWQNYKLLYGSDA